MVATRRFYSNVASPMYFVPSLDGVSLTSTADVAATVGGPAAPPSGWPATPAYFLIDRDLPTEELVQVTVVSGSTVTFKRAGNLGSLAYGSTTHTHDVGAKIEHVTHAADADEANLHVTTSSGVHGVTGALVGTTDVQVLSNKTLSLPVIADFSSAQHTHLSGAQGGMLSIAAITDLANQLSLTATAANLTAHTGATSGVHGAVGNVVGATDTVTLTNKTLTGPIINGGTLSASTLTTPTITGLTLADAGSTVLGLAGNKKIKVMLSETQTTNASGDIAITVAGITTLDMLIIQNYDGVTRGNLVFEGRNLPPSGNVWFMRVLNGATNTALNTLSVNYSYIAIGS